MIVRADCVPSRAALSALESALSNFRLSQRTIPALTTAPRRHASHQAQGRANKAADGAGRRLGAKKTAGQYVVTGNILYRQRGTVWHPGDNCFMGRDHTIHAAVPGYVTYYRDPSKHTKRKYIGIVFNRGDKLPQPEGSVRRRRLGLLAQQMHPKALEQINTETTDAAVVAETQATTKKIVPVKRVGTQFRETNWDIGRTAERVGTAESVEPYVVGDRWKAWRKRVAKKKRWLARQALLAGTKKGKKKRSAMPRIK